MSDEENTGPTLGPDEIDKKRPIKKPGQETEYTPERIAELKRCQTDPVHFINNYIYLQHPTKGKILFKLYDYQEELVKACLENKRFALLTSRQMGKTQTISIFLLWCALFHKDETIVIASKNNSHAMEIMNRIRFAYEELPSWIKAGCKYYNLHNIAFENGSRIKSEATTAKTGRGLAITRLYLDEIAFINRNIQTEMWRSVAPTLSTGGQMIISSTPNGDNELFAQLWHKAVKAKTDAETVEEDPQLAAALAAESADKGEEKATFFFPMFIPWHRHPDRGPEYLKQMRAELGDIGFRQEVLCEFISSDALLIDSMVLSNLKHSTPVSKNMGFRFWKQDHELCGNKLFLLGLDPSTGSGSDYTVINIVEYPSLEQVGELRLNSVSIPLIYAKLKWVFKYLRRPIMGKRAEILWSFERNGIGEALIAMIQNDDSPDGGVYLDGVELYNEDNTRYDRLGVYTSGKSKITTCLQFKNLIEKTTNNIKVHSEPLIDEMKNFIATGKTYKAKQGSTDDSIMSMQVIIKLLGRLASYDETARKIVYESVDPDSDQLNEDDPNFDQFGGEPVPFVVL